MNAVTNESADTANNGLWDTLNPKVAGKLYSRASAILDAAVELQQEIDDYYKKAYGFSVNGANSVIQMEASKALYHLGNAKKTAKSVTDKTTELKAILARWRQSYLA